jgi:hypothetical protein
MEVAVVMQWLWHQAAPRMGWCCGGCLCRSQNALLTCARAACLPASLQEEDTVVVEAPGGSSATHLVVYRKGECAALPARPPACLPAPCTGQPGSRRLTAAGTCILALPLLSSPCRRQRSGPHGGAGQQPGRADALRVN